MKKTKTFGLFVLAFIAIFFLIVILVGSVLICINRFINIPGWVWFWRCLAISGVVAFLGAQLIVHSTKCIRENKLSFWIEKNYPKLLLGYILFVLTIASINSQTIWTVDMVYEVLTLQWTVFGLSLTIFLVWNVIIIEFLRNKQPKESDASTVLSKYTLAIRKRTYSQEIETTFNTVVLLTINLVLLLLSTSAIYISVKPESVVTQNILLCSFFFTTNSIICLFIDILRPLKKDKEEMLKDNNVTKEDIDEAQAALVTKAIIDGLKAGVMGLDPEKYSEDEKKKLFIEYLEAFRDYIHSKDDSKSDNQKK